MPIVPGALFHLKRKKMLEKRLNQLYGQRENVERLVNAMETVTFQKANIEKMKGAQQALKAGIEELYEHHKIFLHLSYFDAQGCGRGDGSNG